VSLLAILSGCTVGPNYQRPDVHLPKALIEQPNLALSQASSTAQQYVLQDIPTAWWQAFHSQELNLLIEKCLKNNPSVAISQANLNQALENVKIQQAAFFPSVSATFNPTRQSVAKSLASPLASNSYVYNLHTAQLNASYSLDVWGQIGVRLKCSRLKQMQVATM
jgi:outer membrane protein TolC